MPKVEYTAAKGLFQSSGSGVTGLLRRNIVSVTSANKTLSTAESGSLVLLGMLQTHQERQTQHHMMIL